jgi:hypothetical protein
MFPITRSVPLRPGATGRATATGDDSGFGGGRFIGGKLDTSLSSGVRLSVDVVGRSLSCFDYETASIPHRQTIDAWCCRDGPTVVAYRVAGDRFGLNQRDSGYGSFGAGSV